MKFNSQFSLFFRNVAQRAIHKRKELLLLAISFLLSLALLEISAPLVYSILGGKKFSKSDIQAILLRDFRKFEELQSSVGPAGFEWSAHHIVHPYLGFVGDYGDHTESPSFNKYGFYGPEPLFEKSEDTVVVVLTGGSVAYQIYANSGEVILEKLRDIPALSNKDIHLISLALGGFKQPQQLFALSYFLVLGCEFDVVINLDGFNEIALPPTEDVARGTVPFFPRMWSDYAKKILDIERTVGLGRLMAVREKRDKIRKIFSRVPLRYSNCALVFWRFIDRRYYALERSIHEEIESANPNNEVSYQASGPFKEYENDSDLFADLAKIWRQSSEQMAKLCEANGIKYFHFLQPNQYVKGSKVLTAEENELAIAKEDYAYGNAVEEGYDLLVEEGKVLREEGINFVDLTMIFKEEKRTIYSDTCCHFNTLGSDMLAKEIIEVVSKDLR